MKFWRIINIYFLQLFFINGFVIIGIVPFYIFVLGTIPTLISGITFEDCVIASIKINTNTNGGRHNSSCYVDVIFVSHNGITYHSSELCKEFEYNPLEENFKEIGKRAKVRIDHGAEMNIKLFQRHQIGDGFFNSVIQIESKKINSKYMPNNMTWTFFFLWGLVSFIRWLQVSLIPRIKGKHPLQIAFKKQKTPPPSQFNYDKFN